MPSTAPRREPLRAATLYEALLARILADEFAPGDRLPSERELAEHYGTNRNTLREALRRLEHGRLVSVRPGSGVTVLDFRRTGSIDLLGAFLEHGHDAREKARVLLELLEPRLQLVELLISMAAANATAEDLAALELPIHAAAEAEHAADVARLADVQILWLERLVEATHSLPARWMANPMLEALAELSSRHPGLMPLEPSFSAYAADVVAGITARDREAAVTAARRFHEAADRDLRRALLPQLRAPVIRSQTPHRRTP